MEGVGDRIERRAIDFVCCRFHFSRKINFLVNKKWYLPGALQSQNTIIPSSQLKLGTKISVGRFIQLVLYVQETANCGGSGRKILVILPKQAQLESVILSWRGVLFTGRDFLFVVVVVR